MDKTTRTIHQALDKLAEEEAAKTPDDKAPVDPEHTALIVGDDAAVTHAALTLNRMSCHSFIHHAKWIHKENPKRVINVLRFRHAARGFPLSFFLKKFKIKSVSHVSPKNYFLYRAEDQTTQAGESSVDNREDPISPESGSQLGDSMVYSERKDVQDTETNSQQPETEINS